MGQPLDISEYTVELRRLPKAFDGFRIILLGDLHDREYGEKNEELIEVIKAVKGDMIAIVGDFLDGREDLPLHLVSQIKDLCPIYFVTGNHEAYFEHLESFLEDLQDEGVIVLRNEGIYLRRGKDEIHLLGVDDPLLNQRKSYEYHLYHNIKEILGFKDTAYKERMSLEEQITEVIGYGGKTEFRLLLSHRPEQFPLYRQMGIDLTLSGHAHGGHIRTKAGKGLLASSQGFFPKYTEGIYREGNAQMVVTRGLGNKAVVPRINNPGEVVIVNLKTL